MAVSNLPSTALMVGVLALGPGSAQARHRLRVVAAVPSPDAVELDALAPPSRRGTVEQTYGDASFARARAKARAARLPLTRPYPCDPRVVTSAGYICRNRSAETGYGQYDAFTPSYVSAPQTVAVPHSDAESPLLSPVTSLFWAVNSARWDRHD